jgi:hypothetical protein
MIWILRCLALCHFGWSGVLLLAAGWSVWSAFRVLPFMSTGTIWTNLPASLVIGATYALPPAVLGLCMFILGRRLWSPGEQLRTTLLRTHGVLFALGALAVYIGIHSVEAMERSTARGGGLLGPLAYVPLLFGIPVVALAFLSLVAALLVVPRYHPGQVLPGNVSPQPPAMSGKKVFALLSLALLSTLILISGLRPFLPDAQRQEAAEAIDTLPTRTRTEIAALREIASKPRDERRESKAFFRSAVMNGRLGVLMLADREATLALTAANIPTAFDCIDDLERENEKITTKISKQSGPRTREDGETEDAFLDHLNNLNDLLSALRDVQRIPAGLEPFLAYRATRKGSARTVAISLVGKLDMPADKRSWLLFSYVAHGNEEAALTALQALTRLGAQAEPVVDELKRVGQEYWKNPANAALSLSVNQTVEEIEKKVKNDASRALE